MLGRARKDKNDASPGPGQYNPKLSTIENLPSYKIGSSKKNTDLPPSPVPGPGSYPTRTTLEGPKWAFGNDSRSKIRPVTSPGPGAYQPAVSTDSKGFSMAPRRPATSHNSKENPGPGSYTPNSKDRTTMYSLGKSQRSKMGSSLDNPGPGAYSPEIPKSKKSNVCKLYLELEGQIESQ